MANDKTVLLTSSKACTDAILQRAPCLRGAVAASTRSLGVDLAAGKRTGVAVRRDRAAKVRKRATKVKALKAAAGAVRRLAAQSLLPAGTNGQDVTGASWSIIAKLWAAVHVALFPHTADLDRGPGPRRSQAVVVRSCVHVHDRPHRCCRRRGLGPQRA